MSATTTLTAELRAEVLRLEDDLRGRVAMQPDILAAWRSEYGEARASERTSATWEAWVDERVTLAAVAWVLTTVFVRFCEDNGLVKPVWITHVGGRSREALDAQQYFLREAARTNPDVTDREWLLEAVAHLGDLPATAGVVDATSPMWLVQPSGDAATRLLTYWRERDDDGKLLRDLADPRLDTRFLGDLYQDISEDARKRYALLQTPVFVEEFILDRTLDPALNERPLEGFKGIDPTCGSGHFLLGMFKRLLDRWHGQAPGMDERERVQKALDAVHGVDLNPFAVSIARFRLTVAALQACGLNSLEDAPAFRYHLAAGDSLLHGLDQGELDFGVDLSTDRVAANFAYATENLGQLKRTLRNGQYDCVVGNPPYITVKDKALNALYRQHYKYCKGKYALTVPFMERFFGLAKGGATPGRTGQITSNSFMKREFGVDLIEQFLPGVDLTEVIDSEGAWIPGHNMDGTPTVIVIGRNQRPASSRVTAVLSKGVRESRSENAGCGPYWTSIQEHLDDQEFDNDWITVTQLDRSLLASHPWSLSGGGVLELIEAMDAGSRTQLGRMVASIGITSFTLEDEVYTAGRSDFLRRGIPDDLLRRTVAGTEIRDWNISANTAAIFPYDSELHVLDEAHIAGAMRWLWPFRTNLSNSKMFNGETKVDAGLEWWEYGRLTRKKLLTPEAIAFAEIASDNHFALARDPFVFAQTAPIVKLREGSPEDDHLALLAFLNSSAVCFWLRDRCKPKGGAADISWSRTYQFNSTRLEGLPVPAGLPLERGRLLEKTVREWASSSVTATIASGPIDRVRLDAARRSYSQLRGSLISQQEELDWEVYGLFDLLSDDFTYAGEDLPALALGERAFEILLARKLGPSAKENAWFSERGSRPITEIPDHWPSAYRDLVERRIDLIESHPFVQLLERPEHKRRWAMDSWEKQEEGALRSWLLDRLEDRRFWFDALGRPIPRSVAALADEVARDENIVSVLAVWAGRPDVAVAASLEKLLAKEAVPHLAAYRYKESGLRKRAAWESTWELQRRKDSGTYNQAPNERSGDGLIPVPPKYAPIDFIRVEYWSHRGKLDVPKERFILYPDAGRETDPTLVLGWGGWDHADQALALATLIQLRESDGWEDERLVPLIAGLAEVLPWVQQWHNQPADLYGGASPAAFFSEQLEQRMTQVGATVESLRGWRPKPARRGRKAKA